MVLSSRLQRHKQWTPRWSIPVSGLWSFDGEKDTAEQSVDMPSSNGMKPSRPAQPAGGPQTSD